MSVSLLEAVEAAGYNLNNLEDANWLLSKESEFESLLDAARTLVNNVEEEENRLAELEYSKNFPNECES